MKFFIAGMGLTGIAILATCAITYAFSFGYLHGFVAIGTLMLAFALILDREAK